MSSRQSLQHRRGVPTWLRLAACAGQPEATFFPARGESSEPALRVCHSCPVRPECLEHALDEGERFGIWGGHTEAERRRLRAGRPSLHVVSGSNGDGGGRIAGQSQGL